MCTICLGSDDAIERAVRLRLDDRLAPPLFGEVAVARRACATMREIRRPRTETVAELGLADARGILQHRLKHRLQLAGRAGDDLEHFASRGLLLQRLVRSSVRWRSSLSSRVFSMAMTAWAAKF